MHSEKLIIKTERWCVNAFNRRMPWNRLCRAAGIAPSRGEAAARSEQATGGSQ
jgi:hypothetical protein